MKRGRKKQEREEPEIPAQGSEEAAPSPPVQDTVMGRESGIDGVRALQFIAVLIVIIFIIWTVLHTLLHVI